MTIADWLFVVIVLGMAATIEYLSFKDMFKQVEIDKERCIDEEDE